jgi:hypothetical protein
LLRSFQFATSWGRCSHPFIFSLGLLGFLPLMLSSRRWSLHLLGTVPKHIYFSISC